MQETSDEQLVRAFQRGDKGAFEVFVKRHQDRVFRLAGLWLHDSSQAGDVLQETLLRSYTGLGRYRFRAQPATWLMRVCRNVCREFNRRRRFDALDTDSPAFSFAPDYGGGLDDDRELEKLRSAVRSLPERQQQVVGLRVLEELSVEETAQVMGCRPGTVKAHLHKAVNNLRNQFGLEFEA